MTADGATPESTEPDAGPVPGTVPSDAPEPVVPSEPEPVTPVEPTPEPVVPAEPAPVTPVEPTPEPVVPSEPEPVTPVEPTPEPVVPAEPEPVTPVEPTPEPVVPAEPEPAPRPVTAAESTPDPAPEPAPEPPESADDTPGSATDAGAPAGAPPPPVPPPPGATKAARHPDAGQIVAGNVRSVAADELEIELTDGRTAVLHRRNYEQNAPDLTTVVKAMDPVEGAILARDDPRGRVVLSRTWAQKKRAWERAGDLAKEGATVSVEVKSISAKGAVVDVEGLRGFIPASQIGVDAGSEAISAGQTVEAKVIKADEASDGLVLSRRAVLAREQRKAAGRVLSELNAGEQRTGKVVRLEPFGAFVELAPGVSGLVHISELSWRRVGHPSEVVAIGDEVTVQVLEVKAKKRRVRLSMARLIEIPVGQVVEGRVTSLQDYGAFVDIGVAEGLVHKSELAEYPVFTPEEVVTPGDSVYVKVLSVDPERHRVELSIRRAAEL